MSKSSEVEGGGTAAAVAPTGSANASPKVVPVEEGGRGAVPEGSTLGCLEHNKERTKMHIAPKEWCADER